MLRKQQSKITYNYNNKKKKKLCEYARIHKLIENLMQYTHWKELIEKRKRATTKIRSREEKQRYSSDRSKNNQLKRKQRKWFARRWSTTLELICKFSKCNVFRLYFIFSLCVFFLLVLIHRDSN